MSNPAKKLREFPENPVQTPATQDRIARVDSIRFLCALAVLFSHTPNPFLDELTLPFKILLSPLIWGAMNGSAGVVIFFVISGFSIHWPYRNGKSLSPGSFVLSRLVRICLPLVASFGVNFLLGCPNQIPNGLVYWSLYAEIIYYVSYPLVLFGMRRFGWTPLFALGCIGSLAVYLLWNRGLQTFHGSGIGVTWLLGWPAWLLGVRLANTLGFAQTYSKAKTNWLRCAILLSSCASLLLNFHTPIRVGLTLNLFAVLVYFWLRREIHPSNVGKVYGWLEAAGKWSYSLYLVHTGVRVALEREVSSQVGVFFLSIFGALLLAYLFYRVIEIPSHALSRSISKFGPPKV